jgi:antitoxin component YwqK of YwqJK toxin-antitoxin module
MKSILFAVLFFFISNLFFGQTKNDKIIYLDSLWQETTNKDFKYIRVTKDYYLDKETYSVIDYYKSGVIQRTGTTETKDQLIKTGQFVSFYESGKRKSIANYKKNIIFGNYYELYENGSKKLEAEYIEGKEKFTPKLKINQFWNSKNIQTVIDGNGDYEEIGEKTFASGKIKNGFKDGHWEGFDKKIGYTFSENYENQKLISGVSIDSNQVEHEYTESEIRPIPKKGMDNFNRHIVKTFNMPKVEGLKGKIYVKFIVEKDGSITDVKVLRDIGYGTGNEAIRVLTNYGVWIPGEQRGIKVRTTFSLPISVQTTR